MLGAVALVVLLTYGFSRLASGGSAAGASATVTLRITSGSVDPMLVAAPLDPAALTLDADTARSFSTAIKAAALLRPAPPTAALLIQRGHELMRQVTVSTTPAQGTISITAHDPRAAQAALIADAFARAVLAVRRAQSVSSVDARLASLARRVRSAPPGVRARLNQAIAGLRAALRSGGQQTEVRLSASSSSSAVLNAWIALALALLLCGVLFVAVPRVGRLRAPAAERPPVGGPEQGAYHGIDEIFSPRS